MLVEWLVLLFSLYAFEYVLVEWMCMRFVLHLKRSNDDETTFFAVSNVNGVLTRSYKLRFKN